MSPYAHPTTQQSSLGFCARRACLIFVFTTIFIAATDRLIAGQPTPSTTSFDFKNEQSNLLQKANSENYQYAQYWGQYERNFFFGPRRGPRQDLDTGPPPDERFARDTKRKVIEQLRAATPPPPTSGPLLLVVSITKQTITLYDAGVAIAESQISSGTSENPTPTGIFSVLEKNWWHRSNIYSAAPMPYMQRINWEGVALHAGELPGYPASHGCIRLTYDFALRLWHTTRIGARVIVSHDDVTPIEISHPKLFVPQSSEERARLVKQPADEPTKNMNGPSVLTSSGDTISAQSYPRQSFLAPKSPPADEVVVQNRVLRPGPISILISQRDQRMYVRKGMEHVFDFPIVITKAGRSLGTHVFTAIAQIQNEKSLRWTVVSMPSTLPGMSSRAPAQPQLLSAAKDALDRLEIPQDALDRVSALMSVGASLIITDRGLGRRAFALDSDYMVETR